MRTLALVAMLVVLAWPLASHAQQQQQQQQQNPDAGWQLHDPNEYRQEDSHPVRAIASLLSPIGWALEWGVARPWHYVATNTFLAPVLNGGQDDDAWTEYYGTPGPVAEVPVPQPPMKEPSAGTQPLREQNLAPAPAPPAMSSSSAGSNRPALGAPPYSHDTQGQTVLH